ncbi:MAG: hypothetical protein ACYS1A_19425 [Planctomycetota bacterium]
MAGLNVKLPSVNQLITIAITLAVLFFILRLLPENVRTWFRV